LAKEKIGQHGIFVQGDYLQLETPEQTPFAGATLINVLYHVEKMQQERLVRKILGDLIPGGKLVIVYSNPRTFSAVITRTLVLIKRSLKRIRNRSSKVAFENPIYFYRYRMNFWDRFEDTAQVKKKAWRTFSPALEKLLSRRRLGGQLLLRWLYLIEKSKHWVRFAEYTLVVLEKNN